MKKSKVDGAMTVEDIEAVEMAYYLKKYDGISIGPSASMNVCAAVKLAKKLGPGHTIVTILCDTGDRYLTKLYSEKWTVEKNLIPTKYM
jgi:cysteine synthase A